MKNFAKIALALGGISAVCAGFAIGTMTSTNKVVEQTKADTVSVGYEIIWETSDNADWTTASAFPRLGAWGGSAGSYTLYDSDYNVTAGLTYYRFVVPTNITGFKFERWGVGESSKWNDTGNLAETHASIVFGTCYYIWETSSWTFTGTTGAAKDGVVTKEFFSKVLDGVQTCSSSSEYGYELYPNIRDNFYSKMKGGEDLTTVNVNDYSYSDYVNAGKAYTGLTPSTTYTAWQKWEKIVALYNAAHSSGAATVNSANNDSGSTLALGGLAAVAILAAGSYFFVRKKKAD